ncbi:MAG TPA: DNA mismatch repair endonuclease MutL [Oscillospiraceae bacterium]|nr:DNA mismatch repair endonuclease MutL [Oscillospiraceae bacterium]
MGKINVLDKQVAELIAAGEVVERPASVMKELVENSIDAGSTSVTVEIKHGGVTYMRVTDNGCGISREDVPVAFLRHATSKVLRQDDLDSIATLGFRGEALASICAVAHVELLTRMADELAGTHYVIEGGEEQTCEDAGCPEGTTIIIRDIFYNVPARMKFLKKDVVEANAVAGIMDKIALSHPEISLRFIRDGKEELHTPGDGKLKSAIYAVFGKEFTGGLIPVDYEFNGVKVWGFLSKPSAARPNRSMQHFFINGRFVKSRTAMVAMEQACKGSLMVGKFPACVLHMQLSFAAVDVNVHPSKLEVRFINEKPIFDAVYHGIKSALNQGDTPSIMPLQPYKKPILSPFSQPKENAVQMEIPIHTTQPAVPVQVPTPVSPTVSYNRNLSFLDIEADDEPKKSAEYSKENEHPIKDADIPSVLQQPAPQSAMLHDSVQVTYEHKQDIAVPIDISVTQPEPPAPPVENVTPEQAVVPEVQPTQLTDKFIGEAFGTYIVLQRGEDELVLIDKHATHERMLYEELKAQSGNVSAQMLLLPVTVTLDKSEYAAVLNAIDVYAAAGFEIEDFGAGTVLVRSAPLSLNGSDVADAVMEIAGYLQSSKTDVTTEQLDWLYHNIACRAAIKAGDESSPQELIALAQRLEQNPDIRHCPHGRPVSIIITKHEIEKQFGRV